MAAINVLNEDAGTPNHAERVSWANQIMQQPAGQAGILLNFVLTNATVSGAAGNPPGDSGTPVSDSDMDYVIASLFDRFALQQAG